MRKSRSEAGYRYFCYNARRKGPAVCTNKQPAPMGDADAAVLGAVEATLLHPDIITKAIAFAEASILADEANGPRTALTAELGTVEAAIACLTAAIANGADLPSVLAALDTHEWQRTELTAKLAALATQKPRVDRLALRRDLKA